MIITGNHETALVMGLIITTIIIIIVMATWILVVGLHCMSIRFMLVDLPPVMPATPIKRRNTSSCHSIDPYGDLMNGAASLLSPLPQNIAAERNHSSRKNLKKAAPTTTPSCGFRTRSMPSLYMASSKIPLSCRLSSNSATSSPLNSGCPCTVIKRPLIYIPCTSQRGECPNGSVPGGYSYTISRCIWCIACHCRQRIVLLAAAAPPMTA